MENQAPVIEPQYDEANVFPDERDRRENQSLY
jgi:hypothetical protein